MHSYSIPLVPGPVSIAPEVRAAYQMNYGSPDLEEEFFELYSSCEDGLKRVLGTRNQIPIQTGEAMLALWGALKSVLKPGERVLAVANGIFGYGIADMAHQVGAHVEVVGFEYEQVIDPQRVRDAALRFRPQLVTAVHCETPCGVLNPLSQVGDICCEVGALYYVDCVASGGGVPVEVDRCHIDLALLGSQKALGLMPDLSFISVSDAAWRRVGEINYVGYDALKPWHTGPAERHLPYSHNWAAMAGLAVSLRKLFAEGLESVFSRHAQVAAYCRQRLKNLGVRLFPVIEEIASPTVTAAYVPDTWTWERLDAELRGRGMVVGGNYGRLKGQVFRIGHMGDQANMALIHLGMDTLAQILRKA